MKFLSLAIALCTLFISSLSAQITNIEGAWRLVSQKIIHPDGSVLTKDSANLHQIKMYTPTMFVNVTENLIPEFDNQKFVTSCAGGRYTINGDVYEEFTEFASWKNPRDLKVKLKITMENGKMHTIGKLSGKDGIETTYDEWYRKVDVPKQNEQLAGTWKMVTQKVDNPDGSVYTADSTSKTMHKFLTNGMVVIVTEQIVPQADNQMMVVSCAGGLYTVKDSVYSEHLSFGSYKGFDSLQSKFDFKIENDKLHTVGKLTDVNGAVSIYDEQFVKKK